MNTSVFEEMIPRLVRAGLEGDVRSLELLAKTAMRRLRSSRPDLAEQISKALSSYGVGVSSLRSVGLASLPRDQDSRLALVRVVEPVGMEPPILNPETHQAVTRFLFERENAERLLSQGLNPPTSMILTGPPGVGKTYLAMWIASELRLPLLILDLASAVSAYLGKTGQNLKAVLDYARERETVLLLDEFDAVAKRRDDAADLGELKRIVNVLLKELEDWPCHSLVIAATNHPDLIDPAIWRRFDKTLSLSLPGPQERQQILMRHLGGRMRPEEASNLIPVLSRLLDGTSCSLLVKFAEAVCRRVVLDQVTMAEAILDELPAWVPLSRANVRDQFTKAIVDSGLEMSVRDLARLLGCSVGNAQRLLKKHKQKGGVDGGEG